jgi:GH25 family lysozyme M1 (1,4-beta-N-acetylmuramidase)
MAIFGPDISNHQGLVNWEAARASGLVDFAIIKASEGLTFRDAWLARNVTELRRLGIPFGTYHYALPYKNDPVSEARAYAAAIAPLGVQAGESTWLDMEDPDLPVGHEAGAWSVAFCAELARIFGGQEEPGIYTYPSYVPERSMDEPGLARFNLWYASYDGDPSQPYAGRVPRPWQQVTIWQYTAFKAVPGLGANIDCNRFEGDVAAFRALGWGGATTEDIQDAINQPDPVTGHTVDPLFAGIYSLAQHGHPLAGSAMYTDGVIRQLFENVILEKPSRKEAQVGTGLGQVVKAGLGPNGYPDWPDVHPLV